MNDHWLRRPVRLTGWRLVLLGLAALAVSAALIGPLIRGRWFMMDDPTILSWLGRDGRLHLADVPRAVRSSEIFLYGVESRCRPLYWLFRIAETALWGDHTSLWFSMRVLLFGGTLGAFAWTLVAAVGPAWSAVLMLYVAAQFYWGDVWSHASLGEQYGAAGLSIFVVAATVFRDRLVRQVAADGPVVLMAAGTIVAVGSKENFAFLIIPLCLALFAARKRCVAGRRAVAAVSCALLLTAYVGLGVMLGLHQAGSDQYGNAAGVAHRLRALTGVLPAAMATGLAILGTAALLLRTAAARRSPAALAQTDATIREQALLAFVIVTAVLTQLLYYDGAWPRFGGRYDFPGRLAEVVVAASAIVVLRRLVASLIVAPATARAFAWTLVAVVSWSVWHHGFHARVTAMRYVTTTSAMYSAVRSAADRYPADSTVPIVLESRDADDYEAAVWTAAVLPAYGAPNPVFLRPPSYAGARPGADTLFQRSLAVEMGRIARDGLAEYRLRPFSEYPAALARAHGRCASLLLREYEPMISVRCADDPAR